MHRKILLFLCLVIVIISDVQALKRVLKRRKMKVQSDEDSSMSSSPSLQIETPDKSMVTRNHRNGRFLSLFTIVRFNNDACPASNGKNGTCYTAAECSSRGGINEGSCAGGFGVCCYFEFNCGRTTSENSTYFANPQSPQRICNLMINRLNNEICQIRIDFETFDISPPDFRGQCSTDFFLVTGGSPVPTLCGTNTGQHVIYSVTPDSGPSQISIVTDTTSTNVTTRQWRMRIHQYECGSPNLAPSGCLQYFSAASGQFTSFNYKTIAPSGDGPNHLANLNYAICFRIANGFCGIKYSQVSSDIYSFTLSGDASNLNQLEKTRVKYSDQNCQQDYLVIPGGSQTGLDRDRQFSYDRFCGSTLGVCGIQATGQATCQEIIGPVVTYTRPFVLGVITDENDGDPITNEKGNRGFNLLYSQLPCANLG
eukprot:04803.XXX_226673_223125_1 [CDS] Oithona nana genome sequencing.